MQPFLFSVNIIVPIFLIILLGWWLRYSGQIDDDFVTKASKVVFNVAMPALMFVSVSKIDFSQSINFTPIFLSLGLVVIYFGFFWIIGRRFISSGRDLGVFIQGSYRGNFGIIGFAIAYGLMGEAGLKMAALYLAIITPFYNVFAVISLTVPLGKEGGLSLMKIIKIIASNPLIIGIVAGLLVALSGRGVPSLINNSFTYLAAMALPLALIGIGGTLKLRDKGYSTTVMAWTCFLKLIAGPIVATSIGILMGFEPIHITIMFILFACPTASASFIMADALGGNRQLAGAAVVFSTIFSVVTLTAGLMILIHFGYVPMDLLVSR